MLTTKSYNIPTSVVNNKAVNESQCMVARSGKRSGKWNFFQVREKSGKFVDGQGKLERTWKVRKKSGNLKINGYGRQSSESIFILFKSGKDVHSHEIV